METYKVTDNSGLKHLFYKGDCDIKKYQLNGECIVAGDKTDNTPRHKHRTASENGKQVNDGNEKGDDKRKFNSDYRKCNKHNYKGYYKQQQIRLDEL